MLYGNLNEADLNHIHTLFLESSIYLKVDIHAMNLITYQPLKQHIIDHSKILFDWL